MPNISALGAIAIVLGYVVGILLIALAVMCLGIYLWHLAGRLGQRSHRRRSERRRPRREIKY